MNPKSVKIGRFVVKSIFNASFRIIKIMKFFFTESIVECTAQEKRVDAKSRYKVQVGVQR